MAINQAINGKRRKRVMVRRKRFVDPSILIDYKNPEGLKRFVTDRGKIIPRRISGATAEQQRQICNAIKRARYLSLLPYTVAHRTEKGFFGEVASLSAFSSAMSMRNRPGAPRHGGDGGGEGGGRYEGGGGRYEGGGDGGGYRGGDRDRNRDED